MELCLGPEEDLSSIQVSDNPVVTTELKIFLIKSRGHEVKEKSYFSTRGYMETFDNDGNSFMTNGERTWKEIDKSGSYKLL